MAAPFGRTPGPVTARDIGRLIRDNDVTTMFLTTALFHLLIEERPETFCPLRQ